MQLYGRPGQRVALLVPLSNLGYLAGDQGLLSNLGWENLAWDHGRLSNLVWDQGRPSNLAWGPSHQLSEQHSQPRNDHRPKQTLELLTAARRGLEI